MSMDVVYEYVYGFTVVFFPYSCTPRNGTAGSHGNSMSNILMNCQNE